VQWLGSWIETNDENVYNAKVIHRAHPTPNIEMPVEQKVQDDADGSQPPAGDDGDGGYDDGGGDDDDDDGYGDDEGY